MGQLNKNAVLRDWLEAAKWEEEVTLLWSGGYADSFGAFEGLCGWGVERTLASWPEVVGHQFEEDVLWMARLSYDLKNSWGHGLRSERGAFTGVKEIELIAPKRWQALGRNGELVNSYTALQPIISGCLTQIQQQSEAVDGLSKNWDGKLKKKCKEDFTIDDDLIKSTHIENTVFGNPITQQQIVWHPDTLKDEYLQIVKQIQNHIVEGDFYELNYCISFSANEIHMDPYRVFEVMAQVSPAPMMCFVKRGNHYLISASMERYLLKRGDYLVSQPIKGTLKNAGASPETLALQLYHSKKDRAENVMIVDLVRNDLSRVCKPGTVKVSELCGIYEYPHVLQMISTVLGESKAGLGFAEIIANTFPMGSMTGAPKIEVMHFIEKFERFSRGWYSGAMGWVLGSDFDLNVVIRGIQYEKQKSQLQYAVGGAITIDSVPEMEFEECMAKAAAVLKSLEKCGYVSSVIN